MADRIEREIEEILRKIDDFVPERPRRTPRKRPAQPASATGQSWLASRFSRISLNQVMAYSLLVVILAFIFSAVPGAGWLMIGALIVFVTAFVLSVAGGGKAHPPAQEKRWRGQPISYNGPAWPNRIKAWIKGKRRR